MGILYVASRILLLRRLAHQRSQIFSSAQKRYKASSTENVSSIQPTSITPKTSFSWSTWKYFPSRTIISSYAQAQEKRPYTTQIGSAVTIWASGDLLAQWIEGSEYDSWRTLRNIISGSIMAIPSYKWYEIMP